MRPICSLVAFSSLLALANTAYAQTPAQPPPVPDKVQEAHQHLRAADAAANVQAWNKALAEYAASDVAAPSIVAEDGIANAHYQLGHDAEAYAAYDALLKKDVQIPASDTAAAQVWDRIKTNAKARIAELSAKRNNATPAPAPAPTHADEPAPPPKRKREREDDDDAPKRTAENAVFIEGGGNGLIYSLNYERLFGDSNFSVRAGFSYMSLSAGGSGSGGSANFTFLTFPLLGNYFLGDGNHKLQLGLGVTLLFATASASSGALLGSVSGFVPLPTAAIGYRYVPLKGGFNFFVGFTPFLIPGGDHLFQPWAGLALGGVF